MFPTLQSDVESRFAVVQSFFRATRDFKGEIAAAAKGMAFVQVYAIYEFTVRSAVQISIDALNAHKTRIRDISPSLLALYLDPELSALKDCGVKNVWGNRLKIFERAFSRELISLSNGIGPPNEGAHYRHPDLIMICKVFGIARLPVPRRRHLFRIDEVVDNRNQIAHGSETAEEVGRRYTRPEINRIIAQMRAVCLLLIAIFDGYCTDRARHRKR